MLGGYKVQVLVSGEGYCGIAFEGNVWWFWGCLRGEWERVGEIGIARYGGGGLVGGRVVIWR